MPQSLKDNLGWIATVLAMLGSLATYQAHTTTDAVERDRDRNHIRQLEKIIVSEWPQWSPAIDWDNR